MGKKRYRSSYNSKGQRAAVSAGVRLVRTSRDGCTRALIKSEAWRAGKNPWITIANPNKQETSRRFIKVQANAVWGDPRRRANIYKTKDEE